MHPSQAHWSAPTSWGARHPSHPRAHVRTRLIQRERLIAYTLAGALFAVCLWLVDWQALQGHTFADHQRYLENFSRGLYNPGNDTATLIQWYANEFLWRRTIYTLGDFYTYDEIFSALSLFALTALCIYVATQATPMYLFLLMHPAFIVLCFSQIRSAVAISIFYLALMLPWRYVRYAAMGLIPFIHSAMVFFAGAFGLWQALRWRPFHRYRRVLIFGYIVALCLVLTIVRTLLLEWLGDRRVNLDLEQTGLLMTIMLGSYGLPFLLHRRMYLQSFHAFLIVMGSALCVALYLNGENGTRFVSLALPAMIVAISRLPDRSWRLATVAGMLASQVVYFAYWTGIV